jgi:hypothetical protein
MLRQRCGCNHALCSAQLPSHACYSTNQLNSTAVEPVRIRH